MPSARGSLAHRVGLTAAWSAWMAATVTLVVTIVVIDEQVIAHEEQELATRTTAFIEELVAEHAFEPAGHAEISDEIREFGHGDALIAVDLDGQRIAGDEALPRVARDGCGFIDTDADRWMACAAAGPDGYRVVVGRPRADVLAHRQSALLAALIAFIVVMVGSVLTGLIVGRWSMAPLTRLQHALATRRPGTPLPRAGLIEVDTVAETVEVLFDQLNTELARSRRFSADAAHELRTPLTKLRAALELMAEDAEDPAAFQRLVARVEGLTTLINRLLLLASPGDALRSATLSSLAATVDKVAEALDARSRILVHDDDDGVVQVDATVLETLVRNGLENALKFSSGPVHVWIRADGQDALLRIDDQGPGIPPEEQTRAFDAFYRGPTQASVHGHGIGLALIAHITQAYGGSARFVEDGPGAHLELRLPRHTGTPGAEDR